MWNRARCNKIAINVSFLCERSHHADPIPQTVPISELRRQQDKILKMAEAAPVVLMSRSEPAGVLVSPQEWNQIVNRLRQLEALQEARRNIAQNDANQSWVSSAEIREKMRSRGVDVGNLVRS